MVTGTKEILELRFSDGSRLRCTPNHRVWTTDGWVRAEHLTVDHKIVRSFHHADRSAASLSLPAAAHSLAASTAELALPEKWDDELAHFVGWLVGDGCLTTSGITTVYGSEADQRDVMPRHQNALRSWTNFDAKPSVQSNGTLQLRSMRQGVRDFFAVSESPPGDPRRRSSLTASSRRRSRRSSPFCRGSLTLTVASSTRSTRAPATSASAAAQRSYCSVSRSFWHRWESPRASTSRPPRLTPSPTPARTARKPPTRPTALRMTCASAAARSATSRV
jgi:hypothetical protein